MSAKLVSSFQQHGSSIEPGKTLSFPEKDKVPPSATAAFDAACKIDSNKFSALVQNKQLGIPEEVSDLIFLLTRIVALKEGLLTPESVHAAQRRLGAAPHGDVDTYLKLFSAVSTVEFPPKSDAVAKLKNYLPSLGVEYSKENIKTSELLQAALFKSIMSKASKNTLEKVGEKFRDEYLEFCEACGMTANQDDLMKQAKESPNDFKNSLNSITSSPDACKNFITEIIAKAQKKAQAQNQKWTMGKFIDFAKMKIHGRIEFSLAYPAYPDVKQFAKAWEKLIEADMFFN